MKLSFICLLFLSILIVSCHSSKSDAEGSDTTSAHQSLTPEEEIFVRLNSTLFEDLVNDNYGPHAVKSPDGIMVLDWPGYESYLKMVNAFGEPFIEQERDRCKACATALDSLKYSGDVQAGWEPKQCPFAYMYWLNSQEKPTSFEVQDLKIEGDHATSKIVFFDKTDEGKNYWNDRVYLTVEYGKEKGQWKIFKLNRLLLE